MRWSGDAAGLSKAPAVRDTREVYGRRAGTNRARSDGDAADVDAAAESAVSAREMGGGPPYLRPASGVRLHGLGINPEFED
jgi:hypothetical protein